MSRLPGLVALLAFLLALVSQIRAPAAVLASASAQAAESIPINELTVLDQRPVPSTLGIALGLSPNGQWFAMHDVDGDRLCVYDVATFTDQRCAAWTHGPIDWSGVAWSPDSSRIAFTEESLERLVDSDLWVFDVEAETLTNLTEDGYSRRTCCRDDDSIPWPLLVDVQPAWTPDGQSLAFSRTTFSRESDPTVVIYQINAAGGTPEPLVTIPSNVPWAVYEGMAWTPDGKHLIFTIALPNADDPVNGLWIVNTDGSGLRQLGGAPDSERGHPFLMDISPRNQALVAFPCDGGQCMAGERSPYGLLDIETGELTIVEATPGDLDVATPTAVSFSPSGAYLLYGASFPHRLIARHLMTGEERLLVEGLWVAPFTITGTLTWATNGTIYAPSASGYVGTLFTVGSGE